ncbi:hypothetical protein GCM10010404_25430 [Nonomuraea africana]|uniref:Uncharacterized protein n=1 Tax=Nonomuraea africana TaxID=46171 RepID=A0ABR9KMW0_9ACTN|nr:hypothetical protein [Nonomuraea africana]MBE1563363.1 hypothetical protein [Nonomuraea africana]
MPPGEASVETSEAAKQDEAEEADEPGTGEPEPDEAEADEAGVDKAEADEAGTGTPERGHPERGDAEPGDTEPGDAEEGEPEAGASTAYEVSQGHALEGAETVEADVVGAAGEAGRAVHSTADRACDRLVATASLASWASPCSAIL